MRSTYPGRRQAKEERPEEAAIEAPRHRMATAKCHLWSDTSRSIRTPWGGPAGRDRRVEIGAWNVMREIWIPPG